MHPELIHIGGITIYAYGFMIMIGALTAYAFGAKVFKAELGIEPEKVQTLTILIISAAVIGGKLFFYLEDPQFYFGTPANLLKNFRQGFVFYGSFILIVPTLIWFFRTEKWPVWPMMDIISILAPIIHGFGRLGCFFAGCCYGLPTNSFLGFTFSADKSQAKPLDTPLHPTQLYEFFLLAGIFLILLQVKRVQKFKGQLFFLYVMLYAFGRSVIEVFRGDLRRGFIIDEVLSHSQFISIILIVLAGIGYRWFSSRNQYKIKKS
jgi:phosphatidylglycerol---prolipoprotein diacylglyceryl transferase